MTVRELESIKNNLCDKLSLLKEDYKEKIQIKNLSMVQIEAIELILNDSN